MEKEKLYTIADIEDLPEGKRAELIDGKLYMMASPTAVHQRLIGFLYFKFVNYIGQNQGGCEAFLSPFAVYLNESDDYVEPDLIIVCDKDMIDERGCHGGPDLVVEVVSLGSKRMDYLIKLFKYRKYGVREYWIVDPEKRHILVYNLEHECEDMTDYTFSEKIPVGIYGGDMEVDFMEFAY